MINYLKDRVCKYNLECCGGLQKEIHGTCHSVAHRNLWMLSQCIPVVGSARLDEYCSWNTDCPDRFSECRPEPQSETFRCGCKNYYVNIEGLCTPGTEQPLGNSFNFLPRLFSFAIFKFSDSANSHIMHNRVVKISLSVPLLCILYLQKPIFIYL